MERKPDDDSHAAPSARHRLASAHAGGHHEEEEEHEEGWIVCYADLMTLLVAVFVLMFSMSSTDGQKASQVTAALTAYLSKGEISDKAVDSKAEKISKEFAFDALSQVLELKGADDLLAQIQKIKGDPTEQQVLKKTLEELGLVGNSTLTRIKPQYDIAIPVELIFRPGTADMTPEGAERLKNLVPTLRQAVAKAGRSIEISGRAGPSGPKGGTPRTLAVLRADVVARSIESEGFGRDSIKVSSASLQQRGQPRLERGRDARPDIVISIISL